MRQILICNLCSYFISRSGELDCSVIVLDGLSENSRPDIGGKSLITGVLVSAFNIPPHTIILGYLIFTGHAERYNQHRWKVKYSSSPAEIV